MPGPSPLMAMPMPPQPGAPLTRGVGSPMPRGPSALQNQPPAPQAPRDNSDLERYLAWLRFVENAREELRTEGAAQGSEMMVGALQYLYGGMATDEGDQLQRMQQGLVMKTRETVIAMRRFAANIERSKPAVPLDCRDLDQTYLSALRAEIELTPVLTQTIGSALSGNAANSMGQLTRIMARAKQIDRVLGDANRKLQTVFRGRGLESRFEIESKSSNSSLLGGAGGIPGFPGLPGM